MYKDKNVLILGFGVTGKAALKAMLALGANVYVYDENVENLKKSEEDFIIYNLDSDVSIDFAIKSPGINPQNEIVKELRNHGVNIYSDLEIAYKIMNTKKVAAITGTNGKTTTTSLVYQILNSKGKTYCVGNIGKGILDIVLDVTEDDYVVIEASSFQLEDTKEFKPLISGICNITSDHLDWHGSVENYRNAKYKIFKNQTQSDFTILNYNDEKLRSLEFDRDVYYFTIDDKGVYGTYVKDGNIYFRTKDSEEIVLKVSDIKMPGNHNLENVLLAVAIAKCFGVENEIIKKAISNFLGVEHRIEFVRELNGVKYYNDSKGTNPDSTIMAINAMNSPTILIAGGYDKKADFTEMLKVGQNKIKHLILLGQTKDVLEDTAKKLGYDIYIVNDMKNAVILSDKLSKEGDTVLLSPACASWDMYTSYEERGKDFKKLVSELI